MNENCSTCKRRLRLVKLDYTHGGCEHTDLEGHICLIFEDEGLAYWMVGCDNGLCEAYAPKDDKEEAEELRILARNADSVVPVVRCKDCLYGSDFDIDIHPYVGYQCEKGYGSHTGDWFCGDGERRK